MSTPVIAEFVGKLWPVLVNLFFTAIGSILFYSMWGRKALRIYLLSDLLNAFHLSERTQIVTELGMFLLFGCSITMGIIHPQNAAQAFSAGLGWTGLVGRTGKAGSR